MRVWFSILGWGLLGALVLRADDLERKNWTRVLEKTPFSFRPGARLIEFKDRLVVYGGKAPGEVWSSPNGLQWSKAEIELSKEGEAVALNTGSFLWIFDFWAEHARSWTSSDGRAFRAQDPVNATEIPRMSSFCPLYRDGKIYLIGGWAEGRATNEIRVSEDGVKWTLIPAKTSRFSPRLEPLCLFWNERVYVLAGRDLKGALFDVWSSANFIDWTLEAQTFTIDARPARVALLPHEPGIVLISEQEIFQSDDGNRWLRRPLPLAPPTFYSSTAELGNFIFSLFQQVSPPRQQLYRLPVPEEISGQPEKIPE